MQTNNKYAAAALEIANLISLKQEAYGCAFDNAHKILEVLYPNGITPDDYKELLTITRVIDKLFRIATNNDPVFKEEPWKDICGYSLLSLCRSNK
jgi:hypothetical protein